MMMQQLISKEMSLRASIDSNTQEMNLSEWMFKIT